MSNKTLRTITKRTLSLERDMLVKQLRDIESKITPSINVDTAIQLIKVRDALTIKVHNANRKIELIQKFNNPYGESIEAFYND